MSASQVEVDPASFDIDDLISRILNVGTPSCSLVETVSTEEIALICQLSREIFREQPNLVEVQASVKVYGNTHGQYSDVLRILDRGGFPPFSNYLFLGDYVDRGHQNLECILLFLAFKVKYPNDFFLLRGNHECPVINRAYGFFEEFNRRYPNRTDLWNIFHDTFTQMPPFCLVGGRILCMHGGLSPRLKDLKQLRDLPRTMYPVNLSLQMDLLWADSDPNLRVWHANTRVSWVFAQDVVTDLVASMDLTLIARAHQVVQDGYKLFANRKMVTIFSAPHYCGQFDNAAAMMCVDAKLTCSFHVMRPTKKPLKISSK